MKSIYCERLQARYTFMLDLIPSLNEISLTWETASVIHLHVNACLCLLLCLSLIKKIHVRVREQKSNSASMYVCKICTCLYVSIAQYGACKFAWTEAHPLLCWPSSKIKIPDMHLSLCAFYQPVRIHTSLADVMFGFVLITAGACWGHSAWEWAARLLG